MQNIARPASAEEILPLRTRQREEMNCQIVHDSIHRRPGWTLGYLLELEGEAVGFGSVAVGGPWKDKPTLFEFYVLPPRRHRAFELFEAVLVAGAVQYFEAQTNDPLITVMVHAYGSNIVSEKIVFRDDRRTDCASQGADLSLVTPRDEVLNAIERRQGGGEWVLDVGGKAVGRGGILFHYNRPYGDIYMEIDEGFRRLGYGAYLVQELKRACYEIGAVPGARCNSNNVASRRTLLRAGFAPCAHILNGTIPRPPA